MPLSGEYWVISVPNNLPPSDPSARAETWSDLSNLLEDVAEVHRFEIPDLRTGTLDKLMKAADNLAKLDQTTEQVVRKVERQFHEISVPDSSESVLEVEEVPTLQYLENFIWNSAKYPTGRQMAELIKSIATQSNKLEEELKESAAYLSEKKQIVSQLQRKKLGNLGVIDLDQVITSEVILEKDLIESEYIKDVAMLIQKNSEKAFLQEYESLASNAVDYGAKNGKEGKESDKGSPVVPNSVHKITDDAEYCLFTIKVLKHFVSEVRKDGLSKRYILKEIDFSVVTREQEDNDPPESEADLQGVSQLRRWCQAHYGEAFSAWVHVKALRVFVESALRYGIPVNFAAALVSVKRSSVKSRARKMLFERYKQLDEMGMMSTQQGEVGGFDELFPYVSYDISAFGTNK